MAYLRGEILAEAVILDHAEPVKRVRVDCFAILEWQGFDEGVADPEI